MEEKQNYRLRDKVTGEIQDTWYSIIMEEKDPEIPGVIFLYLLSEYEDDNIEFEPKYNFHYAKIVANTEGLLV